MQMDPLCAPSGQSFSGKGEDLRPSSTSIVATLRHSPRLLLRKKTTSGSANEPQSPDIFARGPGPALRPSTRLQTRISRMSARARKTSTTASTATATDVAITAAATSTTTTTEAPTFSQPGRPAAVASVLALPASSTPSSASSNYSPSPSCVSDAMEVSRPVSPASSTAGRFTRSALQQQHQQPHPQQSGQHQLPPSPSPSEGNLPELQERPTRVATRSTSQSREREPSRSGTKPRSRPRLSTAKKLLSPTSRTGEGDAGGRGSRQDNVQDLHRISLGHPGSPDTKGGMDDDDADDDDEERFSSKRVLRASARHRRRSFKCSSPTNSGANKEAQAVPEADTRSRLTRSRFTRHSRQDGHLREDYNSMHHRLNESKQVCVSNSGADISLASVRSGAGATAGLRKTRRTQDADRKVPNLHLGGRRLRARSTKVARMGIDDYGEEEEDDDEDEEEEAGDEDEDQEADEEDEDAEYDRYPKSDQDESGLLAHQSRTKHDMVQSKISPQQQQMSQPSHQLQHLQHSPLQSRQQQQNQPNILSASPPTQDTLALLDGFIASKPELPAMNTVANPAAHNLSHIKRKVEEDEEMEDAPVSADEGQLVSTKLARIDDSDGQERSAYVRSIYSILKSPRYDDDGILSSESEDADLESEDDEDDFEEIDVWEFIATLPPLGPLPQNFISTMPDKTHETPSITLVLDIDETLVHCATRPLESPDIIFPVEYNQETWEVYGRIRPGMLEFLEKMSNKFEVITFTASQECYAEALLKIIDPEKKYIKHRYYRDSCVPVFGNYVKDLRILNRDLAKVVIIDNSPQAFGYQLSNGIPIESWYEDKSDRELTKVMEFLETLEGVDDVRPKIDEHYRLSERIQKALAAANHHQVNSLAELEFGSGLPSTSMSSIGGCASGLDSLSSTVGAVSTDLGASLTTGAVTSGLLLSSDDMGTTNLHSQNLSSLVELDPCVLFADSGIMQVDHGPLALEGPDGIMAFATGLSASASTTTNLVSHSTTTTTTTSSAVTAMTIKTRSNSLEATHNLARITL